MGLYNVVNGVQDAVNGVTNPSLRGTWQSDDGKGIVISRYPPKLKHWGTIWVEPLVLARGGESQLFIYQS